MYSGSIKSLWRYPVKSLLGEQLQRICIDTRGVLNDRSFAITTREGKLGSGKNTQRFSRIDGLFVVSAASHEDGVALTFADGTVLTDRSAALNSKLSSAFGQSLQLVRESQVSHFDDASVHILTTGALSRLNELLPESGIDERRFRANIIIETKPEIKERDLVGKLIRIGKVELKVTHRTERCRMVTLEQLSSWHKDLDDRPEILKAIAKNFALYFGVYASVQKTGTISSGESIEIFEP